MSRFHPPTRRQFLAAAGLAPGLVGLRPGPTVRTRQHADTAGELAADLVVAGGGFGGCAAALAAARSGLRVVMTEETDWIGGQLTAQAVPLDENASIERAGATQSYRRLRRNVRDYYRRNFPLTAAARENPRLNPGNGTVSRLCHEPRVGLAALQELLAPHIASGRIRVLLRHRVTAADVQGDRVSAVRARSDESGNVLVLRAPFFVDATELGDLLPLTGTEYVVGAEAQSETGEPHARPEAQPHNQQAFTCCFAMDYLDGEDHVIGKPREYQFWRSYVPDLTPPGRAGCSASSTRSRARWSPSTWASTLPPARGSSATAASSIARTSCRAPTVATSRW